MGPNRPWSISKRRLTGLGGVGRIAQSITDCPDSASRRKFALITFRFHSVSDHPIFTSFPYQLRGQLTRPGLGCQRGGIVARNAREQEAGRWLHQSEGLAAGNLHLEYGAEHLALAIAILTIPVLKNNNVGPPL